MILALSRDAPGLGGFSSDTQYILLVNMLMLEMRPMLTGTLVPFLGPVGSARSWQERWLAALVDSCWQSVHVESLDFQLLLVLGMEFLS